ncbi:MAG: hypothetical protein ACI89D_000599 [Bermanella sp.]|jgi:hypothetical protein
MFEVLPEARRMAYLEVMGVESYFPRITLPGAKASVLCETLADLEALADNAVIDSSSPEGVSSEAAPQRATGHDTLRALMPKISGIEKPLAKKINKTPPNETAIKAEVVRFNLRFFQVPGLAMIVDSSPDSAPDASIQRFAANLLLALSGLHENWEGAIKTQFQQHVFRWPVGGNAQIEQGEQAAMEAVSASVLANCERHAIPVVLLLGKQAAHFGAGDYPDARVLSLESVSHYLMTPVAKRELWHAVLAAQ